MQLLLSRRSLTGLLAAIVLAAAQPCVAPDALSAPKAKTTSAKTTSAKTTSAKTTSAKAASAKKHAPARPRHELAKEAGAYWDQVVAKRRVRIAKRRNNEPITLEDYVLTQPPLYIRPL